MLNRRDMVPQEAVSSWTKTIKQQGLQVFDTDAKLGHGIQRLKKALIFVGSTINERSVLFFVAAWTHCFDFCLGERQKGCYQEVFVV